MTEMFPITEADKLACAQRELAMRRLVYPRWVAKGRITQQNADWQIRVMEEIVKDYEDKRPAGLTS